MNSLFKQEKQNIPSNLLKDRYHWPPFSILNTITQAWQNRKDEWELIFNNSIAGRDTKRYNATPTNTFSSRGEEAKKPQSVSEFDPFLAELMYRWFSKPGMKVLDPFAGGCVRGVVASVLGRDYTGIDLSNIQVTTNIEQYNELRTHYSGIVGNSTWIEGDSLKILPSITQTFDFVFTCPPYYNLERYTNDDRDLSRAKTYQDFLKKYTLILYHTTKLLNPDSFFVIVVSEVRANQFNIEDSEYVGLVPDTIRIMRDLVGLKYYNEIILENNIGSLPIRTPKSFDRSRKIGRHHQNILVFYKGDISHIEAKFGNID